MEEVNSQVLRIVRGVLFLVEDAGVRYLKSQQVRVHKGTGGYLLYGLHLGILHYLLDMRFVELPQTL